MKKLTTHDELVANVGKRVSFVYGDCIKVPEAMLTELIVDKTSVIFVQPINSTVGVIDKMAISTKTHDPRRNISPYGYGFTDITLLDEPEQYIPKFGERALFSDYEDCNYYPNILLAHVPQAKFKFICVDTNDEDIFNLGEEVNFTAWKYCKPLEKKTLTLTKQQIAEKFEVDDVVIEE